MKLHALTTIVPIILTAVFQMRGLVIQRDDDKVAAAWYAGWHSYEFPPEAISWSKYTHVTYAFAVTTQDVSRLEISEVERLPEFVETAHSHGVKALLSIGGYTGSQWFSQHVGTEDQRATFVNTVTTLAQEYSLDGIDIDWEYPGRIVGANVAAPNDTANFLEFLRLLRQNSIGSNLILTVAAGVVPFSGADGNPVNDVTEFATYLDWIGIMNYDVWGRWSPAVGPNAPLDDSCATANNKIGSATSAVAKWSQAGLPQDKMVLGVAAYGRSYQVSGAAAYDGKSRNQLASYPTFTAPANGDSMSSGENYYNYKSLVSEGFVNADGSPRAGMGHRQDPCSQTPYVYNPNTGVMVSYDDPMSFGAKGGFIQDQGLRGFAMWEAGGDFQDRLLDSIRGSSGF